MDLQKRKIEFVQEFLAIRSEVVIARLENLLRKENETATTSDLKPMSVEEFNDRINKSMEDSKNGRLTKASDLKAKIDSWS